MKQKGKDLMRQREVTGKKEEEGRLEKVTGAARGEGGRTGQEEEKRIKGLCDLCKESEGTGRGEDSRGKAIERSDWGEEG